MHIYPGMYKEYLHYLAILSSVIVNTCKLIWMPKISTSFLVYQQVCVVLCQQINSEH